LPTAGGVDFKLQPPPSVPIELDALDKIAAIAEITGHARRRRQRMGTVPQTADERNSRARDRRAVAVQQRRPPMMHRV
jgi:hypothetical protein